MEFNIDSGAINEDLRLIDESIRLNLQSIMESEGLLDRSKKLIQCFFNDNIKEFSDIIRLQCNIIVELQLAYDRLKHQADVQKTIISH